MSQREQFIEVWEREFPTTVNVLRAFPVDQGDFKPAEKCRTGRELAWIFAQGEAALEGALKGALDFSTVTGAPPATMEEVVAEYEQRHAANVALAIGTSDAELAARTVNFPTGPGEMGEWTSQDFMWFILMDSIHHRGQMSIYLRLVDAKVPSIYGPSADEPWS